MSAGVPAPVKQQLPPEPQVLKTAQEEDILSQLLPREETSITPKMSAESQLNIIPQKKMRSRSLSPSDSESSSTSTESDKQEIKSVLGVVVAEVKKNTSALQFLEKSVLTLAEAVTSLTKAFKGRDIQKEKTMTETSTRGEKQQRTREKEGKLDRRHNDRERRSPDRRHSDKENREKSTCRREHDRRDNRCH